MIEKEIRGRIVHAIYRYIKANNNYMKKIMIKILYHHILCI